MKDTSAFVYAILEIWNLYQRKESLYRQVLALDDIGPIRRTCSQGYMTTMLFKRDINWIYDQVKCTLEDGNINECKMKQGLPTIIFASEKECSLTAILLEQEGKMIRLYQTVLDNDDLSFETCRILTEHLEKLKELHLTLQRQVSLRPYAWHHVQDSVA
jgi:hypothetical protein